MNRIFLLCFLVLFTACQGSGEESSPRARKAVEDGDSGPSTNARRAEMNRLLQAVVQSKTIAEEDRAIERLLKAVKDGRYKLGLRRNEEDIGRKELKRIAVKESVLTLEISCPYFPPVTPWISHRFHNYKNALALKDVVLEP